MKMIISRIKGAALAVACVCERTAVMAGSLRKRCEWAWCQVRQSESFAVGPQVAAIEKALAQGQITPTKIR
ncbi:hypothetical protein ALP29_201304 [Pseudomonas syringae pv. avii]|uniref:Uncharacterized protein n=1 Tax=Pseudomonas syringae pv. avii TaxID=663959 RepID=A0A3M5UNR4_PSESX|nr:hypothetical protein ALP29_201304 [Pseudomonas syringae pv. avii]